MARGIVRDGAVGVGVGAASGLLGIGGGILLVPYLSVIERVPQRRAQATSLVLVAMAAASGAITYAWRGEVALVPAAIILITGLAGAWLGAHLVQRLHDHRLRIAFGVLLILAAIRMALGAPSGSASGPPAMSPGIAITYAIAGLFMGIVSALFGIGGGIILIPILVTGLGFDQQLANGTSLAVMTFIALLGAIRLTRPGFTDWRRGLQLGAGAIVGAALGALLALHLPSVLLSTIFAVALALVGVLMIRLGWKQRAR